MKTHPPNKTQKGWREDIRFQGCVMPHDHEGRIEIHHVVGRTARHLGVDIGHWFILPLCTSGHRLAPGLGYDDQKRLFVRCCAAYFDVFGELPFDSATLLAIMDWRR